MIFKQKKTYRVMAVFSAITLFFIILFFLTKTEFHEPYSPIVLDRDNNLLAARIATDGQWRFPPVDTLSPKYITAVTTFEDKRFFSHIGVDPISLVRAIKSNLSRQKRVSGASTITMQTIRLSRNNNRTYSEKFTEIFLAFRLELHYSKNEILTMYASHAPFGGNIVGIAAASRFYFRREVSKLTWAESALLAVLPNNPSMIHPGKNRNRLKAKRDRLLTKLHDLGKIDDMEYNLAIDEPIPTRVKKLKKLTPQLLNSLTQTTVSENNKYKLTLKRDLQKGVADIAERYAKKLKLEAINNAAVVVVDNKTAEIVCYIANTGYGSSDKVGQFVDIVQSPRSSGSILKPFLFNSMLLSGDITPSLIVGDIPTQYGGFMPSNFDKQYRGAVKASTALTMSLNIPTVRMLKLYGVNMFYEDLKNFGVTTLHRDAYDYGLTLILGGAEVKLYDIANIYSKLAQSVRGNYIKNCKLMKDEISDSIYIHDGEKGAAYLTLKTLLDVYRPGVEGYWQNFASSRKVAWKTGTSFGLRDAWAVGVTPKYTTAVWVGNASGKGVVGISGIQAAAPLMFEIINYLGDDSWFYTPQNALKTVKLCKESGMLATEICPSEDGDIPINSNFNKMCQYHKLLHLDKNENFQVDSRNMSVGDIVHKAYFILPPILEFYYSKQHPEYKKAPPVKDAINESIENQSNKVMSIVYPTNNAKVYVPIELSGERGAVVFQAVHKNPESEIFWHIDDDFIERTKDFHDIMVTPEVGKHTLTIVDNNGNYVKHQFEVLGLDDKKGE